MPDSTQPQETKEEPKKNQVMSIVWAVLAALGLGVGNSCIALLAGDLGINGVWA